MIFQKLFFLGEMSERRDYAGIFPINERSTLKKSFANINVIKVFKGIKEEVKTLSVFDNKFADECGSGIFYSGDIGDTILVFGDIESNKFGIVSTNFCQGTMFSKRLSPDDINFLRKIKLDSFPKSNDYETTSDSTKNKIKNANQTILFFLIISFLFNIFLWKKSEL